MKPERGAAPVASLDALSPEEAWLVSALRRWCAGPEAQAGVWDDFAAGFGAERGTLLMSRFEDLVGLTLRHARRQLMLHHPGCRCVGADEAVFANFVSAAATGEREDAMLIATLLVRADVAPVIVSLAQTVGLELARGAMTAPAPATGKTLH